MIMIDISIHSISALVLRSRDLEPVRSLCHSNQHVRWFTVFDHPILSVIE